MAGNEQVAVVEFAPYQKVVLPKEGGRRRGDPKMNSLDQDPDYLRFLEILASGPEVGHGPRDSQFFNFLSFS